MARHTIWSGAGLVVANMIGVGVMISTGFMAQDMGPIPILLAWAVGAGIALCGVLAYSGLALQISESWVASTGFCPISCIRFWVTWPGGDR